MALSPPRVGRVPSPAETRLRAQWLASGLWSDQTLADALSTALRAHESLPFRVFSTVRPYEGTLGDILDGALRFGAGLRGLGVTPGDRVLVQCPNWAESMMAFIGTILTGAVVVPLAPFYGAHERAQILEDSHARVLVVAESFGGRDVAAEAEAHLGGTAELEHIVVIGERIPPSCRSFQGLLADGTPEPAPVATGPDDLVLLAFTSGTTGRAKGVLHTSRSLLCEGTHHAPYCNPPQAPQLVASPLSHASGLVTALLTPVLRGEEVNLIDRWDPAVAIRAATEFGLSIGGGVPMLLQSVFERPDFDPSQLGPTKIVSLGGSAISVAFCERLVGLGLEVIRAYGSTEHLISSASTLTDPIAKRITCDGHAMPGVELRVVDDAEQPVAPGVPGELWSRGPDLCAGYLDPEATGEAFTADGWFRTGDIATLDDEGWLRIVDRKKDIIIRSGFNISAREVEIALETLSAIAEVAVVGQPDARTGERAVAVVRQIPGAAPLLLADLQRSLEARGLARYKWPERLVRVDALPLTASGKVAKNELRTHLRAGEVLPGELA